VLFPYAAKPLILVVPYLRERTAPQGWPDQLSMSTLQIRMGSWHPHRPRAYTSWGSTRWRKSSTVAARSAG